ncbi:RagB/SusD family nutrient uptake outer membrane protein [Leeuwenhoekiella blandensis]|uniref:Putative outer membrane protein, probably involved in nutrient binding n=1 Tax=Leeuwenhoekiella blandensis (strain CECT 7118 / CCUG 51940 / KCTC 22103 / MED217) TaxID=398720 RepID=A3XJY1_LEEBM|nr:RagB/SusD family nutrient uptake outer membrane protein [Leeuwenhoekiella blandensis]EAQ50142.1 putative outer membrane protein, probably involved in nutrient binding [Leeuwenhoekiella blandensis MED217]
MKIRNILYSAVCFSLFAVGCADDFVETTPTTNLPGESIITDVSSAESALIGMYGALQLGRNYGGYDTFVTGLYADEISHTGSFPSLAEIGGNDPALNNTDVTTYWNNHYSAIYDANLIINSVVNPDFGISQESQERIGGQALAARALLYYKLVKTFGGVPLVTDAFTTSSDIDNNPVPRSSVAEVYSQIMSDVSAAVNQIPDGLGIYFFNKNAARVLKAKIEMEMGNYSQAESTLAPVLSAGYSLESDYAALFGNPASGSGLVASSSETIFAIDFNETDGSNHAFFYLDAGRGEVGPSALLTAEFEDGDTRANLITSANDIGKYGDPGNGSDDAYVFRYADVLLMKAELAARRNDPAASSFINQVRQRAGEDLPAVTLTSANVVEAIAHERFVEFYAESSDRYFTITRLGIADEVVQSKPSSVFIAERNNLFPIPQQEIERNSAIGVEDQNPGY